MNVSKYMISKEEILETKYNTLKPLAEALY
jgi:hypothetical protein